MYTVHSRDGLNLYKVFEIINFRYYQIDGDLSAKLGVQIDDESTPHVYMYLIHTLCEWTGQII